MKNILFIAFAFSIVITSCDVLEGPFDEQANNNIDTTKPLRKILLEDYTGHTCGNCPCAAEEAKKLDSIYGERVIVVSTHVGFFAEPYPSGSKFRTDYRTTAGEELATAFDVGCNTCGIGLPAGMVSRTPYNSDRVLSATAWASAIASLDTAVIAELDMSKTYNAGTRTVTIQISAKYLKEASAEHQLVLYAVEDSVINWQKYYAQCSPTGGNIDVSNFVHRHLLRAAVNSTWGDKLYTNNSIIPKGYNTNKTYTHTLDPSWSDKHMTYVAFIQDNVTKEIIQAEEIHLY
jgi:hypothetical protein